VPSLSAVLGQHPEPRADALRRHWGMPRSLAIYNNAELIGRLTERAGVWELQYAHSWMESPRGWDLGPGLPRSSGTITDGGTQRPVQWFFDNLLPEEAMRSAVAKSAKIDEADAFSLLQYLGRESAGSLVLLPEGQVPEVGDQYVPLSLDDLSQRIYNMPTMPMATTGPKRMSIAGAQQKLLVRWDGKTLTEPIGAAPSTHILKPQSTSQDYPHSVINEYAMMRLAGKLGLNVPQVWRLYCPQPVYIVERFDRNYDGKNYERRHLVDTCQLLNMPRAFKYDQASLPTLAKAIQVTRNRANTRRHLWRWLVFNLLIGNHDNHLKNVSFLLSEQGAQLAPAYDLLSTAVYHTTGYGLQPAWPQIDLAIPAPGAPRFADLSQDRVLQAAELLGIAATPALRDLEWMKAEVKVRMDEIIGEIEMENAAKPREAKVHHGGEMRLLRTIRHVVIEDMVNRLGA